METKTISMQEVAAFTRARLSPAIGILFVGDRFHCCDEGIGIFVEGELAGIITIAPEGEQESGEPTIVGLYVAPEYRNRAHARGRGAVPRARVHSRAGGCDVHWREKGG